MKRKSVGQVALVLLLVLVGAASARGTSRIVYVDRSAPPGGDGRSWATAYQHLQDILVPLRTRSSDAPIEIRVAQGIYRPDHSSAHPQGSGDRSAAFELGWGVQVLGGFAGIGAVDPNLRDIVAYPTILSGDLAGNDVEVRDARRLQTEATRGDNSHHVAMLIGSAGLDGVTIAAGHASADDGAVTDPDPSAGAGGGLLVRGKGATIRACVFQANFAAEYGGALHADPSADVLLADCSLEANAAGPGLTGEVGAGGAIALVGGKATVSHCLFRENKALWGGCIYSVDSPHVAFANCLLAGNVAWRSGAVFHSQNASAVLSNCTAVDNRAPEGRFLSDSTSRPARGKEAAPIRVGSCILADDGNEITNGYAALTIRYTDVVGGKTAITDPRGAMVWGPGNLDADPCFAAAGYWDSRDTPEDLNDDAFVAGDYHLKSRAGRWDPLAQAWVLDSVNSPCIDAGDPAMLFDAEPAPNGQRVNMGYYGGMAEASKSEYTWHFVTTQGPLLAEGLGVVLPHEHIFTDLRGPTVTGYGQGNPADVVRVMKPWLVGAHQAGVGVLVECTSIGVGRNAIIVDRVARESGLPVVVPTGVYGRDNFAPPEHRSMTEDELAALFIREIREGIEGTGIKAGFIKTATGSGAMTALEEKFLRAAGRAARETGAAIASHTPVSNNASVQTNILASIDPTIRLIWVHAQSETNRAVQRQLAGRGVYIEFDSVGSNPGQDAGLIGAIQELLVAGYGDRILLSHDAGYYQPGQANGGTQRSYTYLIDTFIPKLRAAGVDEATIRMITEINPVRALGFRSGL